MQDVPKMYRDIAQWFHLVTAPEDYAVEADFYAGLLVDASDIPITTVLELGSGGGNNASYMKRHFEMTLTDLAEPMLEVSRSLNPECDHIQGDMRILRLERTFDAVFVHDAIDYMTTQADLAAVLQTAFEHCRPGGVAVFGPDHVRETFEVYVDCGGHDGDEVDLRYLEWDWDPDPADETYVMDFAYLIRDRAGNVRVEHDRHTCGLFERATWLRLIEEAGFRAERRAGIKGETAPDVFVGVKPRA